MRALRVARLGEAPELAERAPDPARGAGEALVAVAAAPLNPVDVAIASGRHFTGVPALPYVPGLEGVGRVLEGERLAPGTLVRFETRAPWGALAERTVVAEAEAWPFETSLDPAVAACFGIAGLAAWMPLVWRGRLAGEDAVLILGASGSVGALAVQVAALHGARRVVAAGRAGAALERARELGADAVVALDAVEEPVAALREALGGGADLVLDPLWGAPALHAIAAANDGARVVQIGQSAGATATLASAPLRGKNLDLLGYTNFGAPDAVKRDAFARMLRHAERGELRVAHERVPLAEGPAAWRRLAGGSAGAKPVVVPGA